VTVPARRLFTANDLRALLAVRYPAPEWLLCDEAGGGLFNRRVDVIAFNLWHSRGYCLEGFEIKVARQDWRRELATPAKVDDSLYRYCDRWWLVTAPDVATLDEIPAPWGWLEAAGSRLMARKKAPKLEPKPITRAVAAALVKRYESHDNAEREALRAQAFDAARAQVAERHRLDEISHRKTVADLEQSLANYRRRYGWADGDAVAEQAVRLAQRLLSAGDGAALASMRNKVEGLRSILEQVQAFVEAPETLERAAHMRVSRETEVPS